MHDDRRITEVRLDRFVRERIIPAIYTRSVPLTLSSWDVPDEPVTVMEALRHDFVPQEPGAAWGKPWGTKWLRLQGDVPESWGTDPDTSVEIVVDLGLGEGTATAYGCDFTHGYIDENAAYLSS